MKPLIHRMGAITATVCIATFFTSTLLVELLGTAQSIATVKSLIVMPGLFILIPAIAVTGATGFAMSKARRHPLVMKKKRRMPFIAINGLFILLPAAIVLNQWAAAGRFDSGFYWLQAIELVAGATNLVLMFLNIRDGRKMTDPKEQPNHA
ncbi:hypothetical protein MIB92_18720 [Aestuariirhabdus sp. Z084]|uniref:hypothetical protein n=1 Tax=Aestuariirhabdus haliotis TaxID=2918751 RepID=UPI00201B4152|nr:hypothetical protein [Aestuariirhabdus haliotis]MCL6417700.1 hypothetical protein [Aestuariirhabdus haliotis]MCL6421643.1 hypothetical protein [Aestuariirhabdus haliotis]